MKYIVNINYRYYGNVISFNLFIKTLITLFLYYDIKYLK
jgi:hypothetical protein